MFTPQTTEKKEVWCNKFELFGIMLRGSPSTDVVTVAHRGAVKRISIGATILEAVWIDIAS